MHEAQHASVPAQAGAANAGRRRRPRRTALQWRALVEQQQRSGQSVKAFCAERDITATSFYAWRRRLRADANEGPIPSSGFVRLDPRQGSASSEMIEVRFACGATLRCGASHLVDLVHTLKADADGHR